MPVQPLEELEIYCMAEELSDKWYEIVNGWNVFAKDTVGKQLVRAMDSIGANIAESYGRYHFGDKINLLYYSRGSLFESKFWARRAVKRNLSTQALFDELMNDLQVLAPKLNAYIKSKKAQKTDG